MAKFYVGQRVRLVRPGNPVNMGHTGVIRRFFPEKFSVTYVVDCEIAWDRPMDERFSNYTHTSRLEPATDSYDVTTWDSCIWKPEHLRVGV